MQKQRGITVIGFIMVLTLVVFAAFIGLRLFPIYAEYFSVKQSMEGVSKEQGVSSQSPAQVENALFKRLYINGVNTVKKQHVKVTRKNGYQLHVKYERREPLIGNLDVVASFDESVDLTR